MRKSLERPDLAQAKFDKGLGSKSVHIVRTEPMAGCDSRIAARGRSQTNHLLWIETVCLFFKEVNQSREIGPFWINAVMVIHIILVPQQNAAIPERFCHLVKFIKNREVQPSSPAGSCAR